MLLLLLCLLVGACHGLSAPMDHHTLCVSFDGVLCDTLDWRVACALEVAHKTWPNLPSSSDDDDDEWIRNKMRAVSHSMHSSGTSELALLAKCLLEEQALDRGQSVGKTGKYASKYHPREQQQQQQQYDNTIRGVGGRPLTVGEINANWSEGLMETLLVKYHVDGKNPLEAMEPHLRGLSYDDHHLLRVNHLACEALSDGPNRVVVILVPHETDLPMVQHALRQTKLWQQKRVLLSRSDMMLLGGDWVCVAAGPEPDTLQRVGRSSTVVTGRWHTLVRANNGRLASWASDISLHDRATTLWEEQDFVESVTARFVTA